jgi:hypothetical protein
MRKQPSRAALLMPDDVDAIWRDLNAKFRLDRNVNATIACAANYWNATARCVAEQDRKALSAAHSTLAQWCRTYRRKTEEFTPDGPFDDRMEALETALVGVQNLVKPLPPRAASWALVAPMVWQEAARVLWGPLDRDVAGTTAKSIAVRFTSNVLVKLGNPGATPDAVAKLIKNFVLARAKQTP